MNRELLMKILLAGALVSAAVGSWFGVRKLREFLASPTDNTQMPEVQVSYEVPEVEKPTPKPRKADEPKSKPVKIVVDDTDD